MMLMPRVERRTNRWGGKSLLKQMTIDYSVYPVLFVDDEQQNLVAFRYAMGDRFTIVTAASGEEAARILKEQNIAVLMADQRMPGMTGVEVCACAEKCDRARYEYSSPPTQICMRLSTP